MRSIAIQIVRKQENSHEILKLNYLQMRESGCINHYVTVMVADTKAKTVTNKLPQLTVLCVRAISCHVSRALCFISCFKVTVFWMKNIICFCFKVKFILNVRLS
jgi:hypothetical protein